ncbi:hypothetical protein BLOT_000033 [Blomia tropicalis]|nr:hypothetical protein BLOT_000033 [Blomia tropicalis]
MPIIIVYNISFYPIVNQRKKLVSCHNTFCIRHNNVSYSIDALSHLTNDKRQNTNSKETKEKA